MKTRANRLKDIFGLVPTVLFGSMKLPMLRVDMPRDVVTSKPVIQKGNLEWMTEQSRVSRSSRLPKVCPQTKEAGHAFGAIVGFQRSHGGDAKKLL